MSGTLYTLLIGECSCLSSFAYGIPSFDMVIYSPLLTGCPVSGQTRTECASPSACQSSCANSNTIIICITVCVVNGCECPNGTFINDETNSCVHPVGCAKLCECTKEVDIGLACLNLYAWTQCQALRVHKA